MKYNKLQLSKRKQLVTQIASLEFKLILFEDIAKTLLALEGNVTR